MKELWRCSVQVAVVAIVFMAVCGISISTPSSHPMLAAQSALAIGGWSWANFGAGLVCGGGIVAIAAGALSGVGAPAAVLAVTGVVGACIGMVG